LAFFVGLDSGGTKTECWLGDESRVLARAVCGTVKLTRVSQEVATERMHGLLREVETVSGVSLKSVARTCVGVAGFSIGEVREWAQRVVAEQVAGEVMVCGDDEIALDAAFHGGPGVLLIGGTGSAVVGRCADGTRFTAGGWGLAIGDEGSGYWIGREAVRQAFRALDRGEQTTLLEAVRVAWGVADIGGVVGFANQRPGPDFSALAPTVAECAVNGDEVAARVLRQAGAELAEQILVVWGRMKARGERSAQVAFTGSVLDKIPAVCTAMRERIGDAMQVMDAPVHSMDGAMWRARGGGSSL